MERIETLRTRALEDGRFSLELDYYYFKKYKELSHLSLPERYSEAFFYALSNMTPSIRDGELIVGNRDTVLSPEMEKDWQENYKAYAMDISRNNGGQSSHMTVDYELLLRYGINGIIDKINQYLENCSEEKIAFYQSCKRCLEAVIIYSEHYADAALQLSSETTDPVRKAELARIADICRKVPANPASNFYEAIQSVHFLSHCITFWPMQGPGCFHQFQLGHPDRYLLPYYEKDLADGTITKEYAQLLLDCLGIQINMRVPNGLSSGYMVGGRDENGNIVANDLTEMCMQVIADNRLVYPSVGLCYTDGMPDKYLEKACEILAKGHSHPAIFNDDVITKGLIHYGVPEKEAHSYIHSTCVEITPVASSNVWVASPYTNMVQLLLDSMDREYNSLDDLIQTVLSKLDASIKANFLEQDEWRLRRAVNTVNPLLSCFVNDCLADGVDIEQGGARYNWIMPSFVGMANLVDSLYVVKQLIFEEQKMTLCELKAILDNNFEGNEALRLHILNNIPKYGNDNDDIDRYFEFFIEHIVKECEQYTGTQRRGNLIPSVFCWVMHEAFGRQTQASPDGRLSGFPLGDGSGPCQGREMNGPTSSIISSTKWNHSKLIGGVAVNLKFSKAALGANSLEVMKTLIKTYLSREGFEVQINVIDNETLKKARLNPEEYRDLVVRIGGYSDYFVKLSPQMQDEVILRTTHIL